MLLKISIFHDLAAQETHTLNAPRRDGTYRHRSLAIKMMYFMRDYTEQWLRDKILMREQKRERDLERNRTSKIDVCLPERITLRIFSHRSNATPWGRARYRERDKCVSHAIVIKLYAYALIASSGLGYKIEALFAWVCILNIYVRPMVLLVAADLYLHNYVVQYYLHNPGVLIWRDRANVVCDPPFCVFLFKPRVIGLRWLCTFAAQRCSAHADNFVHSYRVLLYPVQPVSRRLHSPFRRQFVCDVVIICMFG